MKTPRILANLLAGTAVAAVIIAVLALSSNLALRRPRLSLNDMHVRWLVDGRDFFVPRRRGPEGTFRAANEELRRMDNGVESFMEHKKPGALRIICIGGSTTRGWPFQRLVSYPRLLERALRDLLPGREIEVINAGFLASDSSSDLPLVREALGYEPDLLLIYEGRNDVANAQFHLSRASYLLKVHAWFLRHVYAYGFLRKHLFPDVFDREAILRDLLRISAAPANSATRALLERNLDRMLHLAREKNCRVALLTQVLHSSERTDGNPVRAANEWLRAFARERGVPLIDVEEAFRNSSIPEDEIVIPVSVHPDLKGYALMAREVARGLAVQAVPAPADAWRPDRLKSPEELLAQTSVQPAAVAAVYRDTVVPLCRHAGLEAAAASYEKRAARLLGGTKPAAGGTR